MIIRFSLENWMSFKDPVTFSMLASRERQHGERLPTLRKYGTKVLPIAALYGGNASGKSNFFKALRFAQRLVVRGTQPDSQLLVEPFRLDAGSLIAPTRMAFELLINDTIYEFSFALDSKAILEERLVVIASNSERELYHRQGNQITFGKQLKANKFLDFAFQGTRDNQLFLTNSVSQKVGTFLPVYNWFKDTLVVITPSSVYESFDEFVTEGTPFHTAMTGMLSQLDTGIATLDGEVVPFDSLPFPEWVKKKLQADVLEGHTVSLSSPRNERFVLTRKNNELIARKLITRHVNPDGTTTDFDFWQESDGTQRVIDLLPAFLDLALPKSKLVFAIDELDRSLHTLLTRRLLEGYLECCSAQSRSQLLFSTHDILLMDQRLLRRDEMWVTERGSSGATTLIPFAEFKDVRYDKDLRKSYLQGRMGGIPKILHGGNIENTQGAEVNTVVT